MAEGVDRPAGAAIAPEGAPPGAPPHQELLGRGTAVRRYIILDRLGAGAMGVVYAAYDRDLDRKVALKLVRDPGNKAASQRLLREAQALGQLSHPNVVAVYDVGIHGDKVFLAMELVAGHTLRSWLSEGRPSRREVMDVFQRAGEGLAAAHAAGIVHRDFKPDNVLIDDTGRVRVADFGLATMDVTGAEQIDADADAADAADADAADDDDESAQGGDETAGARGPARPVRDSRPPALTATGGTVGTPAYMAPEQREGRTPVDGRADQYSFCVSLYEALCGQRPYEIDTTGPQASPQADQLEAAAGHARHLPFAHNVPAHIRRVLARGMAAEPGRRHPSMERLLAELLRDPRGARLRAGIALAALVVVAAVALLVIAVLPAEERPCRSAAGRMSGVWDPARKQAVRAAFLATRAPAAERAWTGVEQAIDGWTGRWVAMHTDACEATHVRGAQSTALLDLRMACLDQRRVELRALVDLLSSAELDPPTVARATEAASALTPLARCAQGVALGEEVRPPDDPARSRRVADLRRRLADVIALREAGKNEQALAPARALATDAGALGYRPLEAEVLLQLSRVENRLGKPAVAEESLYRALGASQAGRSSRISVEAWLELGWIAFRQKRRDDAHRVALLARGALERLGGDAGLESSLEGLTGAILSDQGKLAEARGHMQRSLELSEKGGEPRLATEAHKRLAALSAMQGDLEGALGQQRRATELAEKALGPDHLAIASYLVNQGAMLGQLRRLDESLAVNRRALALAEASEGKASHLAGLILNNIGLIYQTRKQYGEALPWFERSLAVKQLIHGRDSPDGAEVIFNLAYTLMKMKRHPRSIALYRRALAMYSKTGAADHPDVAQALAGLGEAHLLAGKPRRALPMLERAVALYGKAEGRTAESASSRYLLAQALWSARRSRPRAHRLAESARAGFEKAGDAEAAAQVASWLARRKRPPRRARRQPGGR